MSLQAVDAAMEGAVAESANCNAHITISVKAGVPAKLAGNSFTQTQNSICVLSLLPASFAVAHDGVIDWPHDHAIVGCTG